VKRTRVMIVDDSAVVREMLTHIVAEDPRLEVCATAASAEEALRVLDAAAPEVISLDIILPGMDGFEATRQIMRRRPTPIVVVSGGANGRNETELTMKALAAGALAALEKPLLNRKTGFGPMARQLCTQLAIMSKVKVVRQRPVPFPRGVPADGASHVGGLSSFSTPPYVAGSFAMLGIAVSTGGPRALAELFCGLGADFPLPILLVQHMTDSFVPSFANWLAESCPFDVVIVADGHVPSPRTIHMAPADRHLHLEGGYLKLTRGNPVCLHRPSGSVLFESMAHSLAAAAVGVVLTGMGDDGATGLLKIHQARGYTIAEEESTAVVYGMPKAAMALGAVRETLPLTRIAPRLLDLVSGGVQ
jgi:two-component system chemotaxis response regulator CheB